MSIPRIKVICLGWLVIGLLLPFAWLPRVYAQEATYYVAPSGNDKNSGTQESPFATIKKALSVAGPGSTIRLAAGRYFEDPITQRGGSPGHPITITGPRDAVVKGAGGGRLFQINHPYITLDGFSIDGYIDDGEYRDILIFVHSTKARTPLMGVRIVNMSIGGAGGECIRLRYYIQQAEFANNTIGPCGQYDFPGGKYAGGGKNGEGIYIGTAPEQQGDGKNPDSSPDLSRDIHIHHNTIRTMGNECVDVKENASNVLVEHNSCRGQSDPESGGFDARGDDNVFRYNTIDGNIGAGLRFGGDDSNDGINNHAYGNTITNNAYGPIKIERIPQGTICGNRLSGNGSNDGRYGENYPPDRPCPPDMSSTATTTRVPPTTTATRVPPTATATRAPATATATRVPPTATATRVPATATRVPSTATATRVPATATATRVPPTATQTRVPATATRVPATATATRVPPTATATRVPPTATATRVPPTATQTQESSEPTVTHKPDKPTRTPRPTSTQRPTRTPRPTSTQRPTRTPRSDQYPSPDAS